ncbi:hypothetical protein A3N97_03730 [Mycobacteroides abscessus]|uniref:hypothetical protein n=1 Tax=Mycobacteroides abscessus TaxID=36809 RepID=UPI00078D98D1|nr:hypothetical protein [Mycobacteroides abscessus]AMU29799.1 hypothetical protein A3N97_03730 [Mycobacteroides abscessus]SKV58987.1 Uncharacterised protein [Mycobacteroides abscessus subsp. massiliense]
MTEKASRDQFVGPHLSNGDRAAVRLADGTLVEGYWYNGAVLDEPREPSQSAYTLDAVFASHNPPAIKLNATFWPNRPPAPWRICKLDGEWRIERRLTDGYETWCRFDSSAEAFGAFAAGGAR